MNRLSRLFVVLSLSLLLGLVVFQPIWQAELTLSDASSSLICTPKINFTDVPLYGSFQDLQGHTDCLNNPANYRVAVYIYVAGWWTKPYLSTPLTTVQADGTWVTDITTGGTDEEATKIAAFLVPFGYTPPAMSGGAPLPTDLFAHAVDYIHVERERRQVSFAGRSWYVKHSDYPEGPGPNYFSDDPQDVWVDGVGQLHLRIAYHNGIWYSSEIISTEPISYGLYAVQVSGTVNQLNENAVLGLFTWDSVAPPNTYSREVDIEFSRWGNPSAATNAQYVLQPWNQPGNLHPFTISLPVTETLHLFDWQHDFVRFASYQGNQPVTPNLLHAWVYTGTAIPEADDGNARINLWLFNGVPPSDGQEIEIVIQAFDHTPRQATIHVAPGGTDEVGCGSSVWPCATIPYALNLTQTDDTILVAEGTYTSTVNLNKSVQLLGGYEAINWTRDITNHVTLLNGAAAGSVLRVTSNSTATVEGFHITNGRATYGAGVYISAAAPTITRNRIYNNIATSYGGGIYVGNNVTGVISQNEIYQNQASQGGGIYVASNATPLITHNNIHNQTSNTGGGGIYISQAAPVIQNNEISNNEVLNYEHGGGLYIASGTPTVISNTISYNKSFGWGGGLYIGGGTPTITHNDIHHNQAGRPGYTTPDGGGIHLEATNGGLIGYNHIHHNVTYDEGGGIFLKSDTAITENLIEFNSASAGGGISIWGSDAVGLISHNVIQNNTGEGIYVWYYAHPVLSFNLITDHTNSGIAVVDYAYPTVEGNLVMNNTAVLGGGMRIQTLRPSILYNNVIINNSATVAGSGIYISSFLPQLRHNTISGNTGGDGSGIYVASGTLNTLWNSIIANQAVGIAAAGSSHITVNGVLWYNNGANTGGSGTVSVTNPHTGNPLFGADRYHLLPGSPAIDVGTNANVTSDIDGETRPMGAAPDLGADEYYIVPTPTNTPTPTPTSTSTPTPTLTSTPTPTTTITPTPTLTSTPTPTSTITPTPTSTGTPTPTTTSTPTSTPTFTPTPTPSPTAYQIYIPFIINTP